MGLIEGIRKMTRRNKFGPQNVDWCHGESAGLVSISSTGHGSKVRVQCSECVEGRWEVAHYECGKCRFRRHRTMCVKTRENGYRVTFTCTECGHAEEHLQWEA